MIKLAEPSPVWIQAPRHCPRLEFPAYRFTPGLNPHPRGNPQGHSYGQPEPHSAYFVPDRWRENTLYLFGVDLYHQGYFWESHEAWEALWHLTDKKGVEGQFFQGLIQNSAALLKFHLGEKNGAGRLAREALRRLSLVCDARHVFFMGLAMTPLIASIERYFTPVWEANEPAGDRPRLYLEF